MKSLLVYLGLLALLCGFYFLIAGAGTTGLALMFVGFMVVYVFHESHRA